MRHIMIAAACLLVLTPGAALAGHGKAGLWNVTTTMNMAMSLPPAALAQMKASGMKMPGARTVASQMCMTQAEVDAGVPPAMHDRSMDCDTHVTSQTASSMTADMVCRGRMNGTGHTQIAYKGNEHYAGSYSFNGAMEGQPISNSMTFRGDWLKADCGAVKPYTPRR